MYGEAHLKQPGTHVILIGFDLSPPHIVCLAYQTHFLQKVKPLLNHATLKPTTPCTARNQLFVSTVNSTHKR